MDRLEPARDAGKETRGTIMTKVSSRSGQRFAGLQAVLKEMSRPVSGERIAAIKRGDASPAPAPSAAPRTAVAEPKRAAPAKTKAAKQPTAAAAPPKPAPIPVPAQVEARGEVYANAYREAVASNASRLRRLSEMPAAKGRIGALMTMFAEGLTDEQIAAKLPNAKTDREAAIDSIWDRAIAQVFGTGAKTAAPARGGRAGAVWDAAIASVCR